jgi:hypothetical protein
MIDVEKISMTLIILRIGHPTGSLKRLEKNISLTQ